MGPLERAREQTEKKEDEKNELITAARSAKGQFSTKQAAIASLSKRLEELAKGMHLSVSELLRSAENSSEFREVFEEAMSLSQQLAFLKRK